MNPEPRADLERLQRTMEQIHTLSHMATDTTIHGGVIAERDVLRDAVIALLAGTDASQPMTIEEARKIGWDALEWRYGGRPRIRLKDGVESWHPAHNDGTGGDG